MALPTVFCLFYDVKYIKKNTPSTFSSGLLLWHNSPPHSTVDTNSPTATATYRTGRGDLLTLVHSLCSALGN